MVAFAPGVTQAQTYYVDTTSTASLQAQINELYQILEALQAQLSSYSPGNVYSPGGVRVRTLNAANIGDTTASVYGRLDSRPAQSVQVQFEYGPTTAMRSRSLTGQVYDGQYRFRADLSGLQRDTRYYYRAVARTPFGARTFGDIQTFRTEDDQFDRFRDRPDVETHTARDIEDDSAELRGEVDMNDFSDGMVFFVYGEDEDDIDDVDDDYDSYYDVDEDGDDLQKERVDSSLDGREDYEEEVDGLDEDTDYYFRLCVAYEDRDNDDVLRCGDTEDFTTDDENGHSDDDEPEARTDDADDVEDDEAELNGEVDMNDFDDGRVFFIYGEDEDDVDDIEDDYDTYSEIDEDGDDLQKHTVAVSFDGDDDFSYDARRLDDDTTHYFKMCVEYEDEDDDLVFVCGDTEEFTTDD